MSFVFQAFWKGFRVCEQQLFCFTCDTATYLVNSVNLSLNDFFAAGILLCPLSKSINSVDRLYMYVMIVALLQA